MEYSRSPAENCHFKIIRESPFQNQPGIIISKSTRIIISKSAENHRFKICGESSFQNQLRIIISKSAENHHFFQKHFLPLLPAVVSPSQTALLSKTDCSPFSSPAFCPSMKTDYVCNCPPNVLPCSCFSAKCKENVKYRVFFFTGPPLKKTKSKIVLEYPDWASPGFPKKIKVHGLGLP